VPTRISQAGRDPRRIGTGAGSAARRVANSISTCTTAQAHRPISGSRSPHAQPGSRWRRSSRMLADLGVPVEAGKLSCRATRLSRAIASAEALRMIARTGTSEERPSLSPDGGLGTALRHHSEGRYPIGPPAAVVSFDKSGGSHAYTGAFRRRKPPAAPQATARPALQAGSTIPNNPGMTAALSSTLPPHPPP